MPRAIARARLCRALLLCGALPALSATLVLPATGAAAMVTFGSPLSVPATLDTAADLDYQGTNVAVPPTQTNPSGNVHNGHAGADTAIWNVALASGTPAAPADGQIVQVKLEGCAEQATNGPPPLTQFHFQSLTPQGGGTVLVDVTSEPFNIPVCGQDGASNTTVTPYAPSAFCVHKGDYVDFNDEGGFDPNYYPSGVPYEVLGSVAGSNADSFIRDNGTNNGDTLSATDTTVFDGFASNASTELMLQAVLATGPDASGLCGGASAPAPTPAQPGAAVGAQRDGVNHERYVALAVYCQQATPCAGTLTLAGATGQTLASQSFTIPAAHTSHVSVRLSSATLSAIRANNRSLPATLTVTLTGQPPVSAKVTLYT